MFAHHRFDRGSSFVSVVERDGGNVVVKDVDVSDAVHDGVRQEGDVAIDGSGGATGEGPSFRFVMRESRVRVLEVGNCHYSTMLASK